MTDRPVQLVLDTSAILDYCRGSLPVGELLVEIDADCGAVALPLLCLVEAANVNPDDEHWLDMLVQHPATAVVGDAAELWKGWPHQCSLFFPPGPCNEEGWIVR